MTIHEWGKDQVVIATNGTYPSCSYQTVEGFAGKVFFIISFEFSVLFLHLCCRRIVLQSNLVLNSPTIYQGISSLCEIEPKTILIPSLFIKVSVPSQDSDTCVRGIYFVSVSTILIFGFCSDSVVFCDYSDSVVFCDCSDSVVFCDCSDSVVFCDCSDSVVCCDLFWQCVILFLFSILLEKWQPLLYNGYHPLLEVGSIIDTCTPAICIRWII
jgi:hypothetical protein